MLARGAAGDTIVAVLVQSAGISDRQARRDVAVVRDEWAEALAVEEPQRRARVLSTLDHVIAEAIADRAWGAAIAGLREVTRLCGLDETAVRPAAGPSLSENEAVARIDHAASTLALARARGLIRAAPNAESNEDPEAS